MKAYTKSKQKYVDVGGGDTKFLVPYRDMNRKQHSAEMILKSSEIKRKTNLVYQNQSKLECNGFLKFLLSCLFFCYLFDVQMKRQAIYFLLKVFSIVLPILSEIQ